MGDGFSLHLFTEPWDEMQRELAIASDKATMYALRATGRSLIRGARAKAPVYSGSDPRVTPGDLRRSIKNGRTIKHGGGLYELRVSPAGNKKKGTHVHKTKGSGLRGVPLYAPKMEEKYGYMQAGYGAAMAEVHEIYTAAYVKAFAKYAP